jgi:hypothetical protein
MTSRSAVYGCTCWLFVATTCCGRPPSCRGAGPRRLAQCRRVGAHLRIHSTLQDGRRRGRGRDGGAGVTYPYVATPPTRRGPKSCTPKDGYFIPPARAESTPVTALSGWCALMSKGRRPPGSGSEGRLSAGPGRGVGGLGDCRTSAERGSGRHRGTVLDGAAHN